MFSAYLCRIIPKQTNMNITAFFSHFVLIFCLCRKSSQPVSHPSQQEPFAEAAKPAIESHRPYVRKSTYENEVTAVNRFVSFLGKEKTLADITHEDIEAYVNQLKALSFKASTIKTYLASLKAVINRMGGDGRELFRNVSIGKKRTSQMIFNEKQMGMVYGTEPEEGTKDMYARDTFIFQHDAMGMPFVDLMNLTKNNLRDNHIVYRRVKTGEEVSVPLLPELKVTLDKYSREDSPWLFPFWHEGKSDSPQTVLARYNRYLAGFSARYGLPRMTSYTARRTWATNAYRNGIDMQVIQRGLGHASVTTTLRYIQDIDQSAVDAACASMVVHLKQRKKGQKEGKIYVNC